MALNINPLLEPLGKGLRNSNPDVLKFLRGEVFWRTEQESSLLSSGGTRFSFCPKVTLVPELVNEIFSLLS